MSESEHTHAVVGVISQLSTTGASGATLRDLADQAVSALRSLFNAQRVVIQLSCATAHVAVNSRRKTPVFVFSQPIQIRGRQYGRIEVDLHEPTMPPGLTLMTLQTIATLLGLRAEQVALAESVTEREQALEASRKVLADAKLLAQAVGILTTRRGVSTSFAKHWLESDAARAGRTPAEHAALIVLHHENLRSALAVNSLASLRKSA